LDVGTQVASLGLRVCFVSSYPPNRARLSEYAQNLVTALANRQAIDELHLLVDKTNYPNGTSPNPKVKIYRIWKGDSLFSILKVMRYIIKLRPNIVHFNVSFQSFGQSKITNLSGLSLILLSRIYGFKVLAGVHTFADMADLEKFNIKPSVINKVGIFVATKIILSAQNVVVLVKGYGDSLKQRYHHKGVLFIPHGTTVVSEPIIQSNQKTILIFGHMGPHKGLPIILEAFRKLQAEKLNVRLVVAGTNHPNYPHYLSEFIKEHIPNVEFTGYVPQDKLSAVFEQANVVVLPYLAAPGTSGVFHLACGYGRPLVASDLPEIRELVNDGASAILVPPGDVDALKVALMKALFSQEVAEKMGKQNLAFAQRESWSAVAKAYEVAYFNLQK
jgi:glycosyltransferase involved in cell wall biosynthesis